MPKKEIVIRGEDEKFCENCGHLIKINDKYCSYCGIPNKSLVKHSEYSEKSWIMTLIFSFFFGVFGIHRFYTGKIGTGFIWFFTGGLCGAGYLYDLVSVCIGEFKDKEGKKIDWLPE